MKYIIINLQQKRFLAKLKNLLDEFNIDEITINDDRISIISNGNYLQFAKYVAGTFTLVRTINDQGNLDAKDYNDGGGIC